MSLAFMNKATLCQDYIHVVKSLAWCVKMNVRKQDTKMSQTNTKLDVLQNGKHDCSTFCMQIVQQF